MEIGSMRILVVHQVPGSHADEFNRKFAGCTGQPVKKPRLCGQGLRYQGRQLSVAECEVHAEVDAYILRCR
jgi:hypothetical protein